MVNPKTSNHFLSFQTLQMTEGVQTLIYRELLSTLSRNYLYVYIISTKGTHGQESCLINPAMFHSLLTHGPQKRQCSITHLGDHRYHPRPGLSHMLYAGNRHRKCLLAMGSQA